MSVIQAAHRFRPGAPVLELVPPPQVEKSGLDALIEAFVKSRRMQATADSYRKDILGAPTHRDPDRALSYVEYLETRGVDFFAATREDVDNWRQYMENKGLAEATRARRLAAVHGLYTYGVIDWTGTPHVAGNPAKDVKRPRVGNNVQYTGLDADQIRFAIRQVASPQYRLRDRNWVRTAAEYALLVHTGIRRNELVAANVESLGYERGHRVLHIVRKGGKKQTMVVVPSAAGLLEVYLDGRSSGPLILSEDGKRLDGSGVYRDIRRIGDYAFADMGIRLHPHDLRHSCATLLYELGASDWEVQTVLGHADVRTTRRYNHAQLALDRSPLYKLGAALAL